MLLKQDHPVSSDRRVDPEKYRTASLRKSGHCTYMLTGIHPRQIVGGAVEQEGKEVVNMRLVWESLSRARTGLASDP